MIAWSVLPLCIGFVCAGVFALTIGVDSALVALAVGAACTFGLAAVLCVVALVIALAALFRVVETLWREVMAHPADACRCPCHATEGGDEGGGGGGDDAQPPSVVWDSGRPAQAYPRIFPTLMN